MTKVRVPLHGKPHGFASVEDGATVGATVGLNLFWPDGTKVTIEQMQSVAADASGMPRTTDGLTEGTTNLYFTSARADARAAAAIATHEAAGDPHPGYLTPVEGAAAYEPIGAVQAFKDAPALTLANLQNAVDDAAAAALSVAVGALYRNGSALMIRTV